MKTFMKYLLAVTVSLIVGGILGWQAFSYRIRLRIIPFDRGQFRNILIDLITYHPDIDFHFSPIGNTCVMSGRTGNTADDLDNYLTRFATFSTSYWFVVSFNREVTVQQVEDIDTRIRSFGFPKPRMLIEDNRGTQTEEEPRLFREIRISPSRDFYSHSIEWFIEVQQEEATKRIKGIVE